MVMLMCLVCCSKSLSSTSSFLLLPSNSNYFHQVSSEWKPLLHSEPKSIFLSKNIPFVNDLNIRKSCAIWSVLVLGILYYSIFSFLQLISLWKEFSHQWPYKSSVVKLRTWLNLQTPRWIQRQMKVECSVIPKHISIRPSSTLILSKNPF